MKQIFRLLPVFPFCLAFACLALSGCSNNNTSSTDTGSGGGASKTASGGSSGSGSGDAGKKYTIGFSQCNKAEPWRDQMDKDLKAAADKHPEITFTEKDAQNKSETQQAQLREFVQQKVDLIIISPKESRPLTRPVEEAMDAGIPVIVLDRAVEGDKYTCFIGSDNVKIGREAGKYMAKLLNGKGNIVELQGLGTTIPAHDRHNGFMEGIKGTDIKIVFTADCQWLENNARNEMASALSTHPDIDAVYGANDPSAHGAYKAAEQEGKGREKTIKFVGIDGLPHEGQKYVRDGIFAATFLYPTLGEDAIDTALKILRKEPFEKKITTGTKLFTKDNVDKGGETL